MSHCGEYGDKKLRVTPYLLKSFLHAGHATTVIIRLKIVDILDGIGQESCPGGAISSGTDMVKIYTSSKRAISDDGNTEFTAGIQNAVIPNVRSPGRELDRYSLNSQRSFLRRFTAPLFEGQKPWPHCLHDEFPPQWPPKYRGT
jgi:hypothetical protein